jgi:hypothetical protein
MDIPLEDVRTIHAIAEALIDALEEQVTFRGITEGNICIDAAINCLCYAMKQSEPPLEDEELLRRMKKYFEAMKLPGAPGTRSP